MILNSFIRKSPARQRGWKTTRIDAPLKFSDIEMLIKRMQPQKVLLSATTVIPFQKDNQLMERLDQIAEDYPHISFHIGGKGAWAYSKIVKPKNIEIAYTIDDVIQ